VAGIYKHFSYHVALLFFIEFLFTGLSSSLAFRLGQIPLKNVLTL